MKLYFHSAEQQLVDHAISLASEGKLEGRDGCHTLLDKNNIINLADNASDATKKRAQRVLDDIINSLISDFKIQPIVNLLIGLNLRAEANPASKELEKLNFPYMEKALQPLYEGVEGLAARGKTTQCLNFIESYKKDAEALKKLGYDDLSSNLDWFCKHKFILTNDLIGHALHAAGQNNHVETIIQLNEQLDYPIHEGLKGLLKNQHTDKLDLIFDIPELQDEDDFLPEFCLCWAANYNHPELARFLVNYFELEITDKVLDQAINHALQVNECNTMYAIMDECKKDPHQERAVWKKLDACIKMVQSGHALFEKVSLDKSVRFRLEVIKGKLFPDHHTSNPDLQNPSTDSGPV